MHKNKVKIEEDYRKIINVPSIANNIEIVEFTNGDISFLQKSLQNAIVIQSSYDYSDVPQLETMIVLISLSSTTNKRSVVNLDLRFGEKGFQRNFLFLILISDIFFVWKFCE